MGLAIPVTSVLASLSRPTNVKTGRTKEPLEVSCLFEHLQSVPYQGNHAPLLTRFAVFACAATLSV